MERFYLKNIELLNYRRFSNCIFELNPNMNILIGKNASGKTTVLEAVTVAIGAYLAAFKEYVPSRCVQNISESDVLRKSVRPMKNVAVSTSVKQFPCTVGCKLVWDKKEIFYKRSLEKEGGRTKFIGRNPMKDTVGEWEKAIKCADGTDEKQIYPLVLYLSSARLWNENRTNSMDKIPARTDAYQRCLDKKEAVSLHLNILNC